MSALSNVASQERADIVALLLSRGVNVNAQDKEAYTALMFAANNDDTQFAETLLSNKANLNLRDCDGETAFSIALRNRFTVVNILNRYSSNPH